MNGSRARKLRKQVYSNAPGQNPSKLDRIKNYFNSKLPETFRTGRTYRVIEYTFEIFKKDKDGNPMFAKDGSPMKVKKITRQVICTGLRAKYKRAKNAWKMQNAGLIPWVFEGHWCKGTWENYLAGLYGKSKIKFARP